MKINLYTIYDSQAQRAINPFPRDNDNVAKRDFANSLVDPASPFSRNPSDYTLYYVGEWDDETMIIAPLTEPTRIINGKDTLLNKQMQEVDPINFSNNLDGFNTKIKPQAD